MATKADRLFGVKWVHVFEEDTPQGLCMPKTPTSRFSGVRVSAGAGQERSAKIFTAVPDDRPVAQPPPGGRKRRASRSARTTAASFALSIDIRPPGHSAPGFATAS